MNTVTFHCPNNIIANCLAILAEKGVIQQAINKELEELDFLDGNNLDENASPEFGDGDYPDHEVELTLE